MLIAIAIPVFTSQLENSREATDAANLRSAYAEVAANYLTSGSAATKPVSATQTQSDWQNQNLKNGSIGDQSMPPAKVSGQAWSVGVTTSGEIKIS